MTQISNNSILSINIDSKNLSADIATKIEALLVDHLGKNKINVDDITALFSKVDENTKREILSNVKSMFEDGKVDENDIQYILKLVKYFADVINNNVIDVGKKSKNLIVNIIKTLVMIFVLPKNDKTFELVMNVIDSSIDLLITNINVISDVVKNKCCF